MKSFFAVRRASIRSSPLLIEMVEPRQLLSASTLDTSFGGSGRVISTYGTVATFNSVVTLPDGKVLATGSFRNGTHKNDFVVARFNSNGSPDTSFGGGTGRVFTDFSNGDDFGSHLLLVGDGKFVVVGRSSTSFETTDAGSASTNFAVARYNANGTLDNSFNGTGRKTVDFVGKHDDARAAAVLSDVRWLVVGTADNGFNRYRDFAAVRLNVNGSVDGTFAAGGKLRSNFGKFLSNDGGGNSYVYGDQTATSVAVLPGGGFLIGGSIDDFFDSGVAISDFALAKYTPNGSLDTSFGGGKGWIQTGYQSGNRFNVSTSMAVLPTGKILMAGKSGIPGTSLTVDLALVRINSNGTVDTSFGPAGSGGQVTTDLNTTPSDGSTESAEQINSFIVQPNGKILATGKYLHSFDDVARTFMVRYTSNGILDSSFSGDGKELYSAITGANDIAAAPGGKAVIAGYLGLKAGLVRFGSDAAATASISGTFFNDLDGDGVKDANEGPLVGWQAFFDYDADGLYTPGEPVATSNASGKYTISGLSPGTYRIREVRLTGWNRTKPAGVYPAGFYDVTVGVGQAVLGKDFGNKKA
jgi:uncharacterized delta-60 repeat protein